MRLRSGLCARYLSSSTPALTLCMGQGHTGRGSSLLFPVKGNLNATAYIEVILICAFNFVATVCERPKYECDIQASTNFWPYSVAHDAASALSIP